MTRPHIHTGRAFTMVELLVVVAIIAVLVAMLIPALYLAKKRALLTYCLTNLKTITVGETSYSIDNSDQLNPSFNDDLASGKQYHVTTILAPYLTTEAFTLIPESCGNGVKKLFVCPDPAIPPTAGKLVLLYGENSNAHVYQQNSTAMPTVWRTLKLLSQVPRPSDVVAIGDGAQVGTAYTANGYITGISASSYNTPSNRNKTYVSSTNLNADYPINNGYSWRFRHGDNNTGCFSFLDGHAETLTPNTLLYMNITVSY